MNTSGDRRSVLASRIRSLLFFIIARLFLQWLFSSLEWEPEEEMLSMLQELLLTVSEWALLLFTA